MRRPSQLCNGCGGPLTDEWYRFSGLAQCTERLQFTLKTFYVCLPCFAKAADPLGFTVTPPAVSEEVTR